MSLYTPQKKKKETKNKSKIGISLEGEGMSKCVSNKYFFVRA